MGVGVLGGFAMVRMVGGMRRETASGLLGEGIGGGLGCCIRCSMHTGKLICWYIIKSNQMTTTCTLYTNI